MQPPVLLRSGEWEKELTTVFVYLCVSVGCARTSFDRKPRPGRLLVPLPVDALATKQMVRNSVQVNYATKHLTEETARKSIPPQIILKAKAHRAGISSHI